MMIDLFVSDKPFNAVASWPGAVKTAFAFNFLKPRDRYGVIAVTSSARLLTCFLIRKKIIGDSSSGSKPTRTT